MPKGTRVDRCYQRLKSSRGKSSAAAICQHSTRQSLKTGRTLRSRSQRGRR